jgi:hypothetical protein
MALISSSVTTAVQDMPCGPARKQSAAAAEACDRRYDLHNKEHGIGNDERKTIGVPRVALWARVWQSTTTTLITTVATATAIAVRENR